MSTTGNTTNQVQSAMHSGSTSNASNVATEKLQQAGQHFVTKPARDIFGMLKDYAQEKPDVAAMWCFGLGLMIGSEFCPEIRESVMIKVVLMPDQRADVSKV